jgi:acyl carrier protein
MTSEEIYAGLTNLFREFFADDTIVLKPETMAEDIEGWDSFNHINLMVAAETKFGIKLTTKEIEGFKNIGQLVRTIETKV